MTRIFQASEIETAVDPAALVDAVADALAAYSEGAVTVPPVGLLHFDDPPGDVHIKYGYLHGGATYVVKIASGFYQNPERGLATADGIMLVYDRETGTLEAVLMDRGYLTELRTGAAGAVAARLLAPKEVHTVGIVGAGVQGRFQLRMLKHGVSFDQALVWSRSQERLDSYRRDMAAEGFEVAVTTEIDEIVDKCDLIVTATPATDPILTRVRPGTHVTALGSDNLGKQELSPELLLDAAVVAADSRSQALHHGECAHAVAAGMAPEKVVELGELVTGSVEGRTGSTDVTIADLTGVAVEDIVVAEMALKGLATL